MVFAQIFERRRRGTGIRPIRRFAVLSLLLLAGPPSALALAGAKDAAQFHGVWIGKSAAPAARHLDLVIRKTKTGFDMTWTALDQAGPNRIAASFVTEGDSGYFAAFSVDPPLKVRDRLHARIEGNSLAATLSSIGQDGGEVIARYLFSVSGGEMTYRYRLSHGGEERERVNGRLTRAKVVL